MTIIGITGRAGCGKSTAAQHLISRHKFYPMSFALPFKKMLATLFECTGIPWTMDRLNTQEGKSRDLGPPFYCTTRHLLQTLGTEWGRRYIHPDVWVDIGMAYAKNLDKHVVFDDVRFDNEAIAIRREGGVIVHMVRPNTEDAVTPFHCSESGVSRAPVGLYAVPDITLANNGDMNDLHMAVDKILKTLRGHGHEL